MLSPHFPPRGSSVRCAGSTGRVGRGRPAPARGAPWEAPRTTLGRCCVDPHFTGEDTEARGGDAMAPRDTGGERRTQVNPRLLSDPHTASPAVGQLRARAQETALVEAATGPRASLSPGDSERCLSNDVPGLPDVTVGASLSAKASLSCQCLHPQTGRSPEMHRSRPCARRNVGRRGRAARPGSTQGRRASNRTEDAHAAQTQNRPEASRRRRGGPLPVRMWESAMTRISGHSARLRRGPQCNRGWAGRVSLFWGAAARRPEPHTEQEEGTFHPGPTGKAVSGHSPGRSAA